jgi:hypothetical protein
MACSLSLLVGSAARADVVEEESMALVTLDGTIFYDRDADGIRDLGEWGIPGMKPQLYGDHDKDGIWTQESYGATSGTMTNSSGDYTFFLNMPVAGEAVFMVRLYDPSFNPNADVNAYDFDQQVQRNKVPAVMTAGSASYSLKMSGGNSRVHTISHCYNYVTGEIDDIGDDPFNETEPVKYADPAAAYVSRPCAGAQPYPYKEGPAIGVAGTQINNKSGDVIPVYQTLIWIPNIRQVSTSPVNFGLAPISSYKVAAVSEGNTGTFQVDGRSITTTASGVKTTSSSQIGPGRVGQMVSTVLEPSGWSVSRLEVQGPNNTVLQTVTERVGDGSSRFAWTLPSNSDITLVAYYIPRPQGSQVDDIQWILDFIMVQMRLIIQSLLSSLSQFMI